MSNHARPYLPEPQVTPAPTPKGNAKKTLVLWIVLIVMFLAIWQFLSPSPGETSATPQLPPCESSWSPWMTVVMLTPLGGFIAFWMWFLRTYQQSIDYAIMQEPGRIALAERRYADAAKIFLDTATKHRKRPVYEAGAMRDLGLAEMWSGRFDEAIAAYVKVERAAGVLFSSGIRTLAAVDLALVNALAGDLPTATRWASEGRDRLAKNKDQRFGTAATLCLAEAIVSMRQGHLAEATALLEKNWLPLREACNANLMRAIEVVRAFAEAGGGVREYNTVAERLVRVAPVLPGELTFLGAKWPEMRAFLDAHHLT